MSDTNPAVDDDAPEVEGVEVAYVDPEPDEDTGGDAVQLVPTGWIRLVIGDTRVRFRPARMGELRALLEAHEEMLDRISAESDRVMPAAQAIDAEVVAVEANDDATPVEVADARKHQRREVGKMVRALASFGDTQRIVWWRTAHELLGVSDEAFPPDDDLPVWIVAPSLMSTAINHWRSVPLDRGKRPKQT